MTSPNAGEDQIVRLYCEAKVEVERRKELEAQLRRSDEDQREFMERLAPLLWKRRLAWIKPGREVSGWSKRPSNPI